MLAGQIPSAGSRRIVSLPFSASGGCLSFLARGPFLHFQRTLFCCLLCQVIASSSLISCLPLTRTRVITSDTPGKPRMISPPQDSSLALKSFGRVREHWHIPQLRVWTPAFSPPKRVRTLHFGQIVNCPPQSWSSLPRHHQSNGIPASHPLPVQLYQTDLCKSDDKQKSYAVWFE